jgi:prepilin-type N-terminal cleavage/methylation domain-containing protein
MRNLRNSKGVTLIEMTIALFILALGLLGLAGLQLVTLQGDTLGQQATLATTLARDKVAELQEADQLANGNDTYVDQVNGVTYARQWIVQPELSHMEMVTVKVQVSWEGAMVDRAVTVNAVVSRT